MPPLGLKDYETSGIENMEGYCEINDFHLGEIYCRFKDCVKNVRYPLVTQT